MLLCFKVLVYPFVKHVLLVSTVHKELIIQLNALLVIIVKLVSHLVNKIHAFLEHILDHFPCSLLMNVELALQVFIVQLHLHSLNHVLQEVIISIQARKL